MLKKDKTLISYKTNLLDEHIQEFTDNLDRYASINNFSYGIEVKPLHCINEVLVSGVPAYALSGLRAALFGIKRGGQK